MVEKLDEILQKLDRIESMLDERYKFKQDEKSINTYLDDISKDSLIGVNCELVYVAYKHVTKGTATKRKLNNAIKARFNLKTKHTTAKGKNIYYWSE